MTCEVEAQDLCPNMDLRDDGRREFSDFTNLVLMADEKCNEVKELALRGVEIYYGDEGVCAIRGRYGRMMAENAPNLGQLIGNLNEDLCPETFNITLPNTDYFTGIIARREGEHIGAVGLMTRQGKTYGPSPSNLGGSEIGAAENQAAVPPREIDFGLAVDPGNMVHALYGDMYTADYLTNISACQAPAPRVTPTVFQAPLSTPTVMLAAAPKDPTPTATPTDSSGQIQATTTSPDAMDVVKIAVAAVGGFLIGAVLVLAFVYRKRITKAFCGGKKRPLSSHPDTPSPSTTINVPLAKTKSFTGQHNDQQRLVTQTPEVAPKHPASPPDQTFITDHLVTQEMAFGECKTPLASVPTGNNALLSESDSDSLYASVRSLTGGSRNRIGPSPGPTHIRSSQETHTPQSDRDDHLYAVSEISRPITFSDGLEGEIEKPYMNFPEALYATVNFDTSTVAPTTPDQGKVLPLGPCEPINDPVYNSGFGSSNAIGGDMSPPTYPNYRSPSLKFFGSGIVHAYSQRSLPKTPDGPPE